MYRAQKKTFGSVFSSYRISTRDWTQVIKLGLRHPYRMGELTGPERNTFMTAFQEGTADLIESFASLHLSLTLVYNALVFQQQI